ncbi:MAG: hypothetical protein P4L50_28890 [Anaerolineaceae bacterium]|nr:hypothetical protein [Anaerolineaceae bacterium]
MAQRWKAFYRVLFSMIVLATVLSCSLFTTLEQPGLKPTATVHPSGVKLSATRPVKTALPHVTATSASASADNIDVDYSYVDPLITVLYPLYGTNILDNYVDITITNHNSQPVRVITETEIPGYSDKSTDTVNVDANGKADVTENPRLTQASIDNLDVERPASFHIRVVYLQNGDEKVILDETKGITMTARRDFPWSINGFSQAEDFQLLAAMVTPTDPSVEGLIRDAANHISGGIIEGGYGGHTLDDNGRVWDRLSALWDAENDNKLTYINTTVTFVPGTFQRIRLPYEVLDQDSGNCIETSLLYASAAEALDLQPAIILIPGHAFVAIRMDDTNDQYYVIETTLIGRADFATAVQKGAAEFQDALPHIQAGDQDYGWVTIADARTAGINPLPWH